LEHSVDRRTLDQLTEPVPVESDNRRQLSRRRSDAHSVAETLSDTPADAILKTFTLGGPGARASALYRCGCVAVDPALSDDRLQVLECPTHAALREQLRRRRSDHH
jgi:hypothetical protein